MQALSRPQGAIHIKIDGPARGPAVVFANSLGTDLRLWDQVLPLLPAGLRFIRYDTAGHGLSDVGGDDLDAFAQDAIAVIEQVALGPVVFIGLSLGGLIAQRVAHLRPDLIRGLVLSNTAARLGTAQSWQDRMDAVQAGGLDSIADAVMQRWFAPGFLTGAALWRNMLIRTPIAGYVNACRALAGADVRADTARLVAKTLVIGGELDGASPPDLLRETADLIQGAQFHIIPGVGHLPPIENPRKDSE